ncbi:hypothetical protein I9P27_01195, partial [Campylobacter jejuni]|nr:hypothetical protein [Campylobacter jejuni]
IKYKRKKYKIINIASFLLYHKLKPQKESYQNEFLEIYILINDYIKLSYETNNLINLNINSINRITNEHNVLTIELEKKQIPKNKKLKIKEDFINLKLPEEFKLIETHKELYLHGMEQKNCVYTRRREIEDGLSAIYSLNYEGGVYTLEIFKRKNKFAIKEIKAKYNEFANKEVINFVEKSLKAVREPLHAGGHKSQHTEL